MSGETEQAPSAWTIDSLSQHILRIMQERDVRYEQRFAGQEKAVNAALIAAKEAVTKAEAAAEKRFDSVNEFRSTLADQQNTFVTRTEWDGKHIALGERLDLSVQNALDRIGDVASRLDQMAGRSSGFTDGYGYIVGIVGVLIAVASIAVGAFK